VATYFVASGGSNTSPYETWAKAATSLATALAAATADNDVVVIQYNAVPSGDAELSVDTIYTFAGNIRLISASNDGTSAYTPTVMGTANWIGNSTTNRYVRFAGADKRVLVYGITARTAGSTADQLFFGNTSSGADQSYDNCYFWNGNTAASNSAFDVGAGGYGFYRFLNCTFRFGATTQYFTISSHCELIGCTISGSGSTPSPMISTGSTAVKGKALFSGCDLSLITGTLVGNVEGTCEYVFDRCKFGAAVTVMAAQTTNPTEDAAKVWVLDSNSGDTHISFGFYSALGSAVTNTAYYVTAGSAAQSWALVTTANATIGQPFRSPWIHLYNTGTSAITPYLEVLRNGASPAAYKDTEVWAETMVKTTSGFTIASYHSDAATIGSAGADQAAGGGYAIWTGSDSNDSSIKIDSGAAVTPAEVGHISMRICVGIASKSDIYVDPQIRT
jgi:hypothetical protein